MRPYFTGEKKQKYWNNREKDFFCSKQIAQWMLFQCWIYDSWFLAKFQWIFVVQHVGNSILALDLADYAD